jgi:hypothetical protein
VVSNQAMKLRRLFFGGMTILVVVGATAPSVEAQADDLSVNDARPLGEAVRLIQRQCLCVITYEDPKWKPGEVIDISASVWHRPDVRVLVPNGGLFTFSLDRDIASHTGPQMRTSLEQVISAYENTRSGPGAFRLISDEAAFHVVPKTGSVLDAPVTIVLDTRPLYEVTVAILAGVMRANGQKIAQGTLPTNFFLQRRITVNAHEEPARVVLNRALMASGQKLSWRLLYDVTRGQHYLNIHFVRYPQPR